MRDEKRKPFLAKYITDNMFIKDHQGDIILIYVAELDIESNNKISDMISYHDCYLIQ